MLISSTSTILLLFFVFGNVTQLVAQSVPSLNGKHLIVSGADGPFDLRIVRNASGYIVGFTGIASTMFDWLSICYNFTYSPLQVNYAQLDSMGDQIGLLPQLSEGVCDILTTATPTPNRVVYADFTHPPIYIHAAFIILQPTSSFNILALIEPFQPEVWIGILLACVAVVVVLYGLLESENGHEPFVGKVNRILSFVFGILLNQAAGNWLGRRMPVVFTAGAWCLVASILVNAYTTLLISSIAAPIYYPLITSIYDLRHRPDIRFVSNRDRNTAAVILSVQEGFFKELGDRLRANPAALCATSLQCVNMVKEGNTVYTAGKESTLYAAIAEDIRTTGKCNLQLSRETFIDLPLAWAIQKNSPYGKLLDVGILRMHQAGLIPKWYEENLPNVNLCKAKWNKDQAGNLRPLRIQDFYGTFIILVAGHVISLLAYLREVLFTCRCQ